PTASLRDTARQFGLSDPEFNELWRTRQPLVITKDEAGGQTTTTYELSPDGRAISRSTNTVLWSPTSVHANAPVRAQPNWEYVPQANPVRQPYRPIVEPDFGLARFFDNPFINPLGVGFPQFATLFPDLAPPPGVTPEVTTRTETDPSGRKVTITTSTWSTSSGTGVPPGRNPFLEPGFFDQLIPNFPNFRFGPLPNSPPNAQNPFYGSGPSFAEGSNPTPPARQPIYPTNSIDSSPEQPSAANPNEPSWVPVQEPTSTEKPVVPLPTLAPPKAEPGADREIDEYLSKVNLTAADIEEDNGEVVKTIVDSKGRVLSARFVLSTVKGDKDKVAQQQPTK
ncbi:hypothetical protein KR018_006024, partial [Drosophila ironensis]